MKFPLWHLGIGARVRNSGNFSCPNNALTPVTFDVIDKDTLGTVDLISFNSRIIIPKAGWYACVAAPAGWNSNATNERASYLTRNGTEHFGRQVKGSADTQPIDYMTVTGLLYCREGDYIQHLVYQNISGGGSLNVVQPTLSVIQIG